MPRIQPVDQATASAEAKEMLDAVQSSLGLVPNIFATLAHSPKVLEGFLSMGASLSKGQLPAAVREQIALAIAGSNGCDYCASAHTAIARGVGVTNEALSSSLEGASDDPKVQAALTFVRRAVAARGWIDDADLQALRDAGYGEGEVVEIVAHLGINLLTNYFNHIAGTDIDFPLVRTPPGARAA